METWPSRLGESRMQGVKYGLSPAKLGPENGYAGEDRQQSVTEEDASEMLGSRYLKYFRGQCKN
jgi:hypothetical protein